MDLHLIPASHRPPGASSTMRVSCGLIHLGGRDVVPTERCYHSKRAALELLLRRALNGRSAEDAQNSPTGGIVNGR